MSTFIAAFQHSYILATGTLAELAASRQLPLSVRADDNEFPQDVVKEASLKVEIHFSGN